MSDSSLRTMIKVIAISDKESSTFSRLLLIVRDSHSNIVAIPDAFESTDATAFNNRRIYLGAAEGYNIAFIMRLLRAELYLFRNIAQSCMT